MQQRFYNGVWGERVGLGGYAGGHVGMQVGIARGGVFARIYGYGVGKSLVGWVVSWLAMSCEWIVHLVILLPLPLLVQKGLWGLCAGYSV